MRETDRWVFILSLSMSIFFEFGDHINPYRFAHKSLNQMYDTLRKFIKSSFDVEFPLFLGLFAPLWLKFDDLSLRELGQIPLC